MMFKLLLFIFCVSSAFAADSNCESPYFSMALPAKVELRVDQEKAAQLFDVGKGNWEKAIADSERFNQVLARLATGESSDAETLKYLKDVRKQASILRSDFLLFSKKHEIPTTFEAFTKDLGVLNDRLEFNAPKLVPKAAKKVQKDFQLRAITSEIGAFKPASGKSIEKQIEKYRLKVLKLLKREPPTEDEFHEMRKLMKHYLALCQMFQALNPNPAIDASYRYLFQLNEELGKLRDESLSEHFSGDEEDEEGGVQELPPHLRRAITDFLDRFRLVR